MFSDAVLAKGRAYLARPKAVVRDEQAPEVFWVQGSASKPYRVQLTFSSESGALIYITCSCPHGANNAGSAVCSHAAAAVLLYHDSI